MLTFTVYSLGDLASYWSMLNGVAMVFGLTGFWASAGLTGSLILLVLVLINFLSKAGGGSGGHSPVLGPLYIGATFVFMSINSSVIVQDIYTGNVIKVDNVPLIITLPSSIMTTGAYKVFQTIDTAFSTVNGSFMSVGTNGMESPLKLLLSLRKGFSTSSPNLALSIKVFAQACTSGDSSGFKKSEYEKASNSLAYLIDPTLPGAPHYNPSGLTFNFPANSSTVEAVSCKKEAETLLIRTKKYMSLTDFSEGSPNTVISANMASIIKPDGTPNTIVEATTSIQNNVIGHLSSAGQNVQDIMQNMLYYDVLNAGLDCGGVSLSPQDSNACWTENAIIRQGLEKWKLDAASSGTFFSKLMAQSIVFLQLMFFGFSPIILLVALFMGEKSLGLFSKYLLFGGWTISWLPFTSVIAMYIQNQIWNRINATSVLNVGGITAGNLSAYYDMVSANISLGADLMGMVPMLSLGLLTGSAMAMASMAKNYDKMSAHSDSSGVGAPALQNVGALHSQKGLASSDRINSSVEGFSGVIPELSRTHDSQSSIQSAAQAGIVASKTLSRSASSLAAKLQQNSVVGSKEWNAGQSITDSASKMESATLKATEGADKTAGLSSGQKKAIQASIGLKIPLTEIGAGFNGSTDQEVKAAESYKKSYGSDYGSAVQAGTQFALTVGSGIKAAESLTDSSSRTASQAASQALQSVTSASQTYSEAASSSNKMSTTTKVDAGHMGGLIARSTDQSKRMVADSILQGLETGSAADQIDFSNINQRASTFGTTGMDGDVAKYAALSEHLAHKATSGGAGAIEAGANFDLLSPGIGSSITSSSNQNSSINNSASLRSEVDKGTSSAPLIGNGAPFKSPPPGANQGALNKAVSAAQTPPKPGSGTANIIGKATGGPVNTSTETSGENETRITVGVADAVNNEINGGHGNQATVRDRLRDASNKTGAANEKTNKLIDHKHHD